MWPPDGCFFICRDSKSWTWVPQTTPDLDITAGSKTHFTAGFWTDSGIPAVMWGSHHCRSLKTNTDLQETVLVPGSTRHCQLALETGNDGCFKSVGSWLKPAVLCKPTLSVRGSNWQCCHNHQCRWMDQTGSVVVTINVGSWLKPAVLTKPTLSVHGPNRQCCCNHQCRLMDQTDSVVVTISVGWWFKPAVLSKPTLSVSF